MTEDKDNTTFAAIGSSDDLARFTESYASFNRIVNSLQRQYLELKEEFSEQNERLVEANQKLLATTEQNLAVTEFLNSILSSIPTGVIAVDQNGRVTHFNPSASVLLGIPASEPLGLSYREIIPPGTPSDANALRAVETGIETESVEKEVELTDGSVLHLSTSTRILRDSEGKADGAVEVFHDLSRIKRMETEIARLNTLAALGEMAATIAHQVRNPLAGIGGFASLLKRDLDPDDPRRKTADKILQGVENLNNTISSLLNYTRSEAVQKEELELFDYIHGVVGQFRHDHQKMIRNYEVRIEREVQEGRGDEAPVAVSLDPHLFREVLNNLLANAVEAGNGSGEAVITCRKLPRQKAGQLYGDRLILSADETVVRICVNDSGPGVSDEVLQKVMSPFFTTKQGGNGLGLAVACKIVKAHGGDILVENLLDGGARFTILIPAKLENPT